MSRELVIEALIDAIKWQDSLADSCRGDDQMFNEAREQAARYRKALKRRTGSRLTPMEKVIAGASTVTLAELRARHEPDTPPLKGHGHDE